MKSSLNNETIKGPTREAYRTLSVQWDLPPNPTEFSSSLEWCLVPPVAGAAAGPYSTTGSLSKPFTTILLGVGSSAGISPAGAG